MWNTQQSQENYLIQLGVLLFFLGLVVGFLVPALSNPRMGLASHMQGIINGIFLIAIGSIWSRLVLAPGVLKVLFGLLIYGTFANWLATLLAAIWGAQSIMPIAAQGHESTASKEIVVDFLLYSLSLAMLASCVILLIGLRRKAS